MVDENYRSNFDNGVFLSNIPDGIRNGFYSYVKPLCEMNLKELEITLGDIARNIPSIMGNLITHLNISGNTEIFKILDKLAATNPILRGQLTAALKSSGQVQEPIIEPAAQGENSPTDVNITPPTTPSVTVSGVTFSAAEIAGIRGYFSRRYGNDRDSAEIGVNASMRVTAWLQNSGKITKHNRQRAQNEINESVSSALDVNCRGFKEKHGMKAAEQCVVDVIENPNSNVNKSLLFKLRNLHLGGRAQRSLNAQIAGLAVLPATPLVSVNLPLGDKKKKTIHTVSPKHSPTASMTA